MVNYYAIIHKIEDYVIVINVDGDDWLVHIKNPHMTNQELKPQQLLKLFLESYKMDIKLLVDIKQEQLYSY